ncbi:hypothetical protein NLG97_g10731 [Lecanicillium saksenae]|uniref:Uncharacterized protein n=1 Tax=Lecanicillium saksenae TaxID=468837 RepID=A0ACC1QE56_9HYPO|nr:hypothetical protein NLG97_g10731 [Lecanicillium saksenae]
MKAPPDGAKGGGPGAGHLNTTSCGQVAERMRRLDTAVESVQVTDDKLLTPAVTPFSLSDEDKDVESPVAWRARLGTVAPCLAIFCFSLVRFAHPRFFSECPPPPLSPSI